MRESVACIGASPIDNQTLLRDLGVDSDWRPGRRLVASAVKPLTGHTQHMRLLPALSTVHYGELRARHRALGAELGYPVLDMQAVVDALYAPEDSVFLPRDPVHLTQEGHRIYASALANILWQNKLVPRKSPDAGSLQGQGNPRGTRQVLDPVSPRRAAGSRTAPAPGPGGGRPWASRDGRRRSPCEGRPR
jgi:hypothetical protein